MKKIAYFSSIFLLTLWMGACQNDQKKQEKEISNEKKGVEIIIEGETASSQKGLMILKKIQERGTIDIDSAEVSGTNFQLSTKISEPGFYLLNVFGQRDIPLVLTETQSKVKVFLDTRKPDFGLKITGSKDTEEYFALEKIIQNFTSRFKELENKYAQKPAELQKSYLALQQESVKKVKSFIDSIGPNLVAIRAASMLDPEEEFEFLENLAKKTQAVLPHSQFNEQFQLKMQAIAQEHIAQQHLQIGKPAPEIKLASPEGKTILLSSLQGKVVLIDFWASWCGPCRQENPNVVKMYDQYKNKGFEIYGVSLDKSREAWLEAIAQDQLTWLHVSDLQFWNSEAAQTYAVRAIPATYLIGKNGTIIAKNLRGPALEAKLAEVLEGS